MWAPPFPKHSTSLTAGQKVLKIDCLAAYVGFRSSLGVSASANARLLFIPASLLALVYTIFPFHRKLVYSCGYLLGLALPAVHVWGFHGFPFFVPPLHNLA